MCKDISKITQKRRASVRSLVLRVARSILRTQGKKVDGLTYVQALQIVEADKVAATG